MNLRFATEDDVENIAKVGAAYAAEAGGWFFDLDFEGSKANALEHLSSTIIGEIDGKFAGLIVIVPTKFQWTTEVVLRDLVYFVYPEYRSMGLGDALLDEAKKIANHLGMKLIMDSFTGKRLDAMDKFYESKGCTRIGGTYLYLPVKE